MGSADRGEGISAEVVLMHSDNLLLELYNSVLIQALECESTSSWDDG